MRFLFWDFTGSFLKKFLPKKLKREQRCIVIQKRLQWVFSYKWDPKLKGNEKFIARKYKELKKKKKIEKKKKKKQII